MHELESVRRSSDAVGHNHFWFRRYAIEAALQSEAWDEAHSHADALAARPAAEPLPHSDLIVERGHILARMGRGTAGDADAEELAAIRAKAAAVDFRIDALRDAVRVGWGKRIQMNPSAGSAFQALESLLGQARAASASARA